MVLFQIFENRWVPPLITKKKTKQNRTVPPLITADSAFPIQPWWLNPYTDAILSEKWEWCQLKGRWRSYIEKKLEQSWRQHLYAWYCTISVRIAKGDTISSKLDLTVDLHTDERRTGQEIRDQLQTTTCCKIRDSSAQAARIRDILADKSWEEKEIFVTTGLINDDMYS